MGHETSSDFVRFVKQSRDEHCLIVQPRMGIGQISEMQQGIAEVKACPARTIGTLTIDSYTRVGDFSTPAKCLQQNERLNGFPIVTHSEEAVRDMLAALSVLPGDELFPVQVRHGTAQPQAIFKRMVAVGLDATEGGPISYCLPYSRLPLSQAVTAWDESCQILANETASAHIESFGGCLLGQLCPPSLLIVISLLECLYFADLGIKSVSMSYAQGTLPAQDRAALKVLRDMAGKLLQGIDWHVVLYTYMGVYPSTTQGALGLIKDSAILAKQSGCERLIVKTRSESKQIPSVADNIEALLIADEAAKSTALQTLLSVEEDGYYQEIYQEVEQLMTAVLNLDTNKGVAFGQAFERGLLDIPYCLHADNQRKSRCYIDSKGALKWARVGNMPIKNTVSRLGAGEHQVTSEMLLNMLSYKSSLYDGRY